MCTRRCELLFLFIFVALFQSRATNAAQVSKQVDSMGRDYYLFTPDKMDPRVTYWLVAEVHGYGGQGSPASPVRAWADRGDCIAVAPSFPNNGYQMLGLNSDQQLIQIFQKLRKDFKLHDKLFVYGHSGGAQYAHRFALKYPQWAAGCCATSAGTWSTGASYGTLNDSASTVPIAISCGESDSGRAFATAPMTRIEWARKFEQALANAGFFYKASYWPNTGHEGNGEGNAQLANEAFSLGTTGLVGKDRANFDAKMKVLYDYAQVGDFGKALTGGGNLLGQMKLRTPTQAADNLAAAGWHAGPPAVSACVQATKEYVAEQMARLSFDVQNAALYKIAALENEGSPQSSIKLRSIYNTFAGWTKVRVAVTQAAHRMQTKLQ